MPLRAIYRRAYDRGEIAVNPTLKLALSAVRGRRDGIPPRTRPQRCSTHFRRPHGRNCASGLRAGSTKEAGEIVESGSTS
jgi:hypothetical protein